MTSLRMRSKHWIVDEDGNMIMGEGRKEIFETIVRTGSLNQTAKIMKMSYRGVWGRVKATEKAMNTTLVHTDRKLGSSLTKEGEELLAKYSSLKEECLEKDDKIFDEIFQGDKDKKDQE